MLGWKKKLVEQVVYLVCAATGLSEPSVNFKGCSQEKGQSELAHYHPDLNMICFSERQLTIQDFNTLKSTSIHEVVHALGLHDHGPEFERMYTAISVKLAIFNLGTVVSPPPSEQKSRPKNRKKSAIDTSPEAEYRRLIARLEEARSKEERMQLAKEIYELHSHNHLDALKGDKKFDEVLNIIKNDSYVGSKEWEEIINNIYKNSDYTFGSDKRQFDENGNEVRSINEKSGGFLKWIRKRLKMKS